MIYHIQLYQARPLFRDSASAVSLFDTFFPSLAVALGAVAACLANVIDNRTLSALTYVTLLSALSALSARTSSTFTAASLDIPT